MAKSATEHECFRLIQCVSVTQYPVCRVPGCEAPSVAGHHLFPRARMGTAFNPKAVFAVCQVHHDFAHAHPIEFREIARQVVGDEYEALRELSLMEVQFRAEDFRRIKAALTALAKGG